MYYSSYTIPMPIKCINTINTERPQIIVGSMCRCVHSAKWRHYLKCGGRVAGNGGSRILSDGVVGRDAVAGDAVGVAIFKWVGRTGVRIGFFVSRSGSFSPPTFSSLPFFVESRRRGSKPFSASPPGDSSSRAFRFRLHLSLVSLRDMSVSFCFI